MKVLNAADALKQESEDYEVKRVRETNWTPQPDKTATGKSNLTGMAANFLGENPSWASSIRSGSFDTAGLVRELKKYFAAQGVPLAGYGTARILKPVQQAIQQFDDFGGRTAATNIPIAKVFKGQPEAPVAVAPPPPVAAAFQDIISALASRQDPTKGISDFRQTISDMLTVADYPYRGACAYGVGGTGKSYHWKEVVKELGLTAGIGYREFGGKVAGNIQQLQESLYNARNSPLVIFDDCDDIFSSPDRRNLMKQAMQDDGACKIFVTEKITDEETTEKVAPGAYELDSHFVFVTNKDPTEFEQALKRRIAVFSFDFNNEEMAEIIRAGFSRAAPEFDVSDKEKENILQTMMATIGQKGGIQRIEFGTFKKVLMLYGIAKASGQDTTAAIITGIRRAA
jgi:hypothetical protein